MKIEKWVSSVKLFYKWKRPLGARKTLLIETNSHAVKRLKSESAAGGWGIPPDPHN
jgi:hypothetical protein